jgi:hypothetical protein
MDRVNHSIPACPFNRQLKTSGAGYFIFTTTAALSGLFPLDPDPALFLNAVQGRKQRSWGNGEGTIRNASDSFRYCDTVEGLDLKRAQDQEIQSPLNECHVLMSPTLASSQCRH